MENKSENTEPRTNEAKPEWQKPQVTEFDVNSITQSAFINTGTDNAIYS